MKEVTRERLEEIVSDPMINQGSEFAMMARMALTAMDSESDERYQKLSDLYHAQEKRLFKIAQFIKGPTFDKYSHSPSQAIDVLEAAIFGEDESCRAAMLNQK